MSDNSTDLTLALLQVLSLSLSGFDLAALYMSQGIDSAQASRLNIFFKSIATQVQGAADSTGFKATKFLVSNTSSTMNLLKIPGIASQRQALTYITITFVQKAAVMANFAAPEDFNKCAMALATFAGDAALTGIEGAAVAFAPGPGYILAPATLVSATSAFLAGVDIGNQCFVTKRGDVKSTSHKLAL